jgi:integrase
MLPSLALLEKIQQKIQNLPNRQGEYKRQAHYCCYLLCEKAGLRVSEAVNFDLTKRTRKGLYRLNKTKGQKKRYVYIPKKVISELKKHNWQPRRTNRFNFYHFLRKIKRELNLPANTELTPHTLRRAFATYQAENGLPLPLLSKMLGHESVRTTALYWMNVYNEDDDTADLLVGKN